MTLYWQTLEDIEVDYIVQLHLISEDGQIISSASGRPINGGSPTRSWKTGDLIEDSHILKVEPGLPPGSYLIDIALIDSATNQRQNIVADDGHWIDNHLLLAPIKVEGESKDEG